MSEHRIDVISFTGVSPEMERAQDEATAKLQQWYAQQVVLFTGDGGSVFEFSTSMCMVYPEGSVPSLIFTITVFDTRHRPDRPPHVE